MAIEQIVGENFIGAPGRRESRTSSGTAWQAVVLDSSVITPVWSRKFRCRGSPYGGTNQAANRSNGAAVIIDMGGTLSRRRRVNMFEDAENMLRPRGREHG